MLSNKQQNDTNDINRICNAKFFHRNLITQIRNKKIIIEDSLVYVTYYFYDEAGNRIRKNVYQYIGIQPSDSVETPDLGDITDMTGYWDLIKDEVYSRDLSGKEVALYVNGNIMQNNIWGLGNEGYITSAGALNFYLKDHLGSIRAVTDENNSVISAQDYDCWGYLMQSRQYDSDESVYKFTGKERDEESFYDYFGARYYDSRIGRWGQVEPLLKKYLSVTPYNYSLDNPLVVIDPNGKDPKRSELGNAQQVENILRDMMNSGSTSFGVVQARFESPQNSDVHYIATEKGGFIDLKHFFVAASLSSELGSGFSKFILALGEGKELIQTIDPNSDSGFDPEDPRSNAEGVKLGIQLQSSEITEVNIKIVIDYLNNLGVIDPSDKRLSKENVLIQENATDSYRAPNRNLLDPKYYRPFYGQNPNQPDVENTGF
ncbi:MAG TPA: RHS repeat-associated core domain-containing protein [Ignavibacteria bacterium]|nr:RHS repeat-associated core domain-containing protein [Ignavibacteria bacterium]